MTSAAAEPKRYPRAEAINVAKVICDALKPVCSKLIVAGSLRRRKPTVKDVEILFVPLTDPAPSHDFFEQAETISRADAVIEQLLSDGIITKRLKVTGSETWGTKNKLAVHQASGIAVDLFAATEVNWINYVVCRTGGMESNIAIATAAQDRGWKWNPYGSGFTRISGLSNEQHVVTSERDVFEFVGLPYKEPWERE